jgi:pyridoxamine 5'-phosphate oxidase
MCISSYSKKDDEVNSRFVNLKFINSNDFIFFTNYESPKSVDFKHHPQVSCVIFWDAINTQIRLKGKIKRTSTQYNDKYFKTRSPEKNALAISSDQSKQINSFEDVKQKYLKILNKEDLTNCPHYWGGYIISPYYIEYWKGNKSRLNKREAYILKNKIWEMTVLEP